MPHLAIPEERLARFCRKQHIRRLSLFGSTLAGTARPDSDIDLLVEFEPGHEPGLLGLARKPGRSCHFPEAGLRRRDRHASRREEAKTQPQKLSTNPGQVQSSRRCAEGVWRVSSVLP